MSAATQETRIRSLFSFPNANYILFWTQDQILNLKAKPKNDLAKGIKVNQHFIISYIVGDSNWHVLKLHKLVNCMSFAFE